MDLTHSAADEAFRATARAWLDAHLPRTPLPSPETAEGFAAHRAWEAELAADRWSVVDWPAAYGGRGSGLVRWLIFEEEYYAAGAPARVGQNGIHLLAPTLFAHGTREQRARVLPPMASGRTVWAQAWSEPEAGSDLASLRSRAVRTGTPLMRFLLDPDQRAFAASLDARLTSADTPAVIRDWSRGDPAPGRALWSRIAEAGVFALAVPEEYDGLGLRPVELAVAFVELGRHAVPGPLAETVAAAALLAEPALAERFLSSLAAGTTMATLTPVDSPYALDGDTATTHLSLTPDGLRLSPGPAAPARPSLDPARRLTPLLPGGELLSPAPPVEQALTWARLATAAQALGVGLALLGQTVAHVRQRTQFGVAVGSFQAVKHRLADARIALDFARPLVYGAALTLRPADVAAAKVTACEAAYTTARTALQLHGAIGYTAEYDLSLWLTKARALRGAWGGPDECRDVVLSARA
ncbi:acyl-CoA dehydrogenase family protein [Streptomyces sp. NPDC047706]|uniref:acyl-CoA dehydrogenase family protein n=1 Tax=Streptomyces sp. NPDC047706 TaxID=3365486 RepID=UPI0037102189